MLIRNNAPVFGANASPYAQPGEWQVNVSSRNLISDDHYNGTVEQVERQHLANYVRNTQNLLDIGVTRVLTRRASVTLAMPFVNSTWALRDPAFPLPQARREIPQNGRGIGDITIGGRAWMFEPRTHKAWNVSAGAGLKLPTGNSRYQDRFIDRTTREEKLNYVDQSVQPGDGGWGVLMEAQAFWRVRRAFLFASGSYLANPRDTNDTPSILAVLGIPTGEGTPNAGLGVNSVPDQYLARVGGTVPVAKGISASLAWRMEGLSRYDLFGDSHGWRRPGTAMFVEPGVSYTSGPHTVSLHVPLGYYYNRHRNPYTNRPGDATFPRHIFLSSYSLRLGARATVPATDQPPPLPAAPPPPSGQARDADRPEAATGGSAGPVPAMAARTICPVF